MPPVIGAIAAYAAGALAATAGWSAFAIAAIKLGVSFVVSTIASKLMGSNASVPSQERRETIRSPAANRRVIYGQVRTGGVAVHGVSTGDNNKYLHLIIVLAHGEVSSIDPVFWINDRPSNHADFKGKIVTEYHLGKPDQAASAGMMAADPVNWTAAHTLSGIAYVYLRLEFDSTAFPSGIPSTSFLVNGRKLYDPRSPAAAPAYSTNSALALLDYLRAPFGMNAPDDLIDMPSFVAAANICDELIASSDPLNAGLKRYTCNGMIDLGASPASIIEAMQSSCAGHLVFSNGKYRLYPGAYNAPVGTITADMLRDDPVFRPAPSRSSMYNIVRGTYIEPRQDWQEFDYDPQIDEDAVAAQGEIAQTLNLPFTTNGATCQRLANIALQRAAGGASIKLPLNWSGLMFMLYDVVKLNLPGPAAFQSTYRIIEYTLAEGGGIDVTLQAEDASMYTWTSTMESTVPALPPVSLAPAFQLNGIYPHLPQVPPTLTARFTFNGTNTGLANAIAAGTIKGLYVQWAYAEWSYDPMNRMSTVVKANDEGDYVFTAPVDASRAYKIRARMLSGTGTGGDWVEATVQPSTVTTFNPGDFKVTVPALNVSASESRTVNTLPFASVAFDPAGTITVTKSSGGGSNTSTQNWSSVPTGLGAVAGAGTDYFGGELYEIRATSTGSAQGSTTGPSTKYGLDAPWLPLSSPRTWRVQASATNPTSSLNLKIEIRSVQTKNILSTNTLLLTATSTA